MIEESLRRALRDQVELIPPGQDRAEEIIRRTRRTRRWRTTGTALAAVLAFAMLISGVTFYQLMHSGGGYNSSVFEADPTALPKPIVTASINPHDVASLGLDLRIGDQLWTTDGRRLDLGGFGDVERAYRVPEGWLYGGTNGAYLQPVSGSPVQVAPEGSRWSVSEDGKRIAVVADGRLSVAGLSPTGAQVIGSVGVPADAAPTVLLGSRVLVVGGSDGNRGYGFVTVDGAQTAASPSWNRTVSGVFGTRSDAAVGLASAEGSDEVCLAALRPDGPTVSVTTTELCGFEPPGEDITHTLSPDGGWLAEPAGDGLSLVSLDNALVGSPTAKMCEASGVGRPTWIDARTVVAPYDDGVVRCETNGGRKLLAVPVEAGSAWDLVPRLGSADG